MHRFDLVLTPRLTPPQPHRRLLTRPRLLERLREALEYRLTIVQAGTGYGKSTALATLQGEPFPLFWYTLDASDRDPQQFLAYLIAAFRSHLPQALDGPLALLAELANGPTVRAEEVIDALINALDESLTGPALLVLDDYQSAGSAPEINALVERFLTFLPARLHVVLSTLHPVHFTALPTWRGRGEVLEVGRTDLAFRSDEVVELFAQNYGIALADEEVALLHNKTEGWPIVLQLVWQGLRSGAVDVHDLLAGGVPASPVGASATLFHYLARELLDRQSPAIGAFLRETAVLGTLTPGACAAVRGEAESAPSAAALRELDALDLFVVALGEDAWRYHHLFHDFLRAQGATDVAGTRTRHRRAAAWHEAQGADDEAIGHWLAAQEFEEAARVIEAIGESVLQAGRLTRLADWIDALPPDVLAHHPRLHALLGDTYRLRSLFDSALAWYAQAEAGWRARDDAAGMSRALRGQALVYLDTVRAAQAESLLQEALRLADGTPDREARARLLMLMAENKLNLGKPAEAETLRRAAETLRNEAPDDSTLDARVKLRTGRLTEARDALEVLAASEERALRNAQGGAIGPPRADRETVLLLSLVEALMGQSERAYVLAQEGIALGERLESPFITAVGYMRLGHALQLGAGAAAHGTGSAGDATSRYREAIALGDRLAVRRTRAEAMWGLTRAYGYGGDLESAANAAAEGVEIATESGDVWLLALASVALGASCVLAREQTRALPLLGRALGYFRECSDSFGRAATRLWMALAHFELAATAGATLDGSARPAKGSEPGAVRHFLTSTQELLELCETNGYDFLFTRPSLLGLPDVRRIVPLLLAARTHTIRPTYVARLLAELGIADIKVHPGFQLRVQTLGAFRVWRGAEEIEAREWQREKARQLFQLLLSETSADESARGAPALGGRAVPEKGGGRWLQREQIVERLWPQLGPDAAARDFKVALNALVRALEPNTVAPRPYAFIERDGTAYRLRPEADLRLDAVEFESHCRRGLHGPLDDAAIASLRAAVALYGGDFLPDALYEEWTEGPRARLLTLYLRAAERLADALLARGRCDEAIEVCEAMLTHDNCWERAWQLLITAYIQQGNRAQARRVCARCAETLRAELDVPPAEETLALCAEVNSAQ